MSKRAFLVGRAIRAIPVAVLFTVGAGGASFAESCLASPDRKADPGTRWFYRTDPATQQRCFYLKKDSGPASAEPTTASNGDDSIMSWLSSTFGSSKPRPSPTATEQSGASRDAGAGQAAAAKNRPRSPAPAKPAPTILSQQQPGAGAGSAGAGSGGTGAAPFDTGTREALFKEYVEWRKRKGLPAE